MKKTMARSSARVLGLHRLPLRDLRRRTQEGLLSTVLSARAGGCSWSAAKAVHGATA